MSEPRRSKQDGPSSLPAIEGYHIEGVLGRGSTGVVYSAVQAAVDRPVALKLLHRELMGNRRAVRRLQREARTAAKLAHPAIISAIDMGEADGRWWYAMELVEGISLGERIEEQGVMSEREALRFFAPVVDALQYASEAGVTHRDVKPANILVDPHGRARVVDLGLAIADDDPALTSPGGTLGTPHYISPEQARDPSSADTRSDIYSLGASMYHALCGRPPFQGASVAEVLSAVLYHRVPDPRQFRPELSKGIALVLRKCLAREPEMRYAEPVELARDFERLRERRAPEVNVAALDPLPGERSGRLWWALLSLAGCAAVAGGWWFWRTEQPAADVPLESFAEVDQLRAEFSGGERTYNQVLEIIGSRLSLRSDASALPAERVAMQAFQADLLRDLDRDLDKLRDATRTKVDALLVQGDLAQALASVGDPYRAALRAGTGFRGLRELPGPERVAAWTTWHRELVQRLEEALEQAYEQRSNQVVRYVETELAASVTRDYADLRYVDAMGKLTPDVASLMDLAEVTAAGIDEVELRVRVEQRLRPILDQWQRDMQVHWRARDRKLELEIEERGAALEDSLFLDPGRDLAAELEADLSQLLTKHKLDLTQIPEDWSRRFLETHASTGVALAAKRQVLREQAARADLERDTRRAQELLRQRRYGTVIDLWEERLAATWRAPVHADMERMQSEAQYLRGFLQRAAEGITSSHLKSRTLYHRSIAWTGKLAATRSPLEHPFRLLVTGRGEDSGELVFVLRSSASTGSNATPLAPPDVEAFASLARTKPSPLEVALFRYHEGDLDGAEAILNAQIRGPEPQQGAEGVLWKDIGSRLEQRRTDAVDARKRRLSDLDAELRFLSLDSTERGATGASVRRRVEALRRSYRDLLSAEREQRLDAILKRASERSPRPTLVEAFPTAQIEEGAPRGSYRTVTLTWPFERPERGSWRLGPFAIERDRLVQASGPGSIENMLAPGGAAILPLSEPIVAKTRLRVEIDFWIPAGSRPNNELVVTVAGYTLVFLDYGDKPRFFGGPGRRADVLEQARGADLGSFSGFAGLDRTKPHKLVIELDPEGAELREVQLGASPLQFPRTYPAGGARANSGPPTLEVRSLQAIEIQSVTVSTNAHL